MLPAWDRQRALCADCTAGLPGQGKGQAAAQSKNTAKQNLSPV